MDAQLRAAVDAVKAEVVKQIGGMRQANKVVPVSGKRCVLPLEGRSLDAVYYEAEAPHAPLLMCFHGGGYLFGGCALDDGLWNTMRNKLNVNVISIDYRKSPDFHWPQPVEDAYDSAVYLKAHASEFGFDKDHISLCGNSAGAHISAAAAVYAQEKGELHFDYQILNYPAVDYVTSPLEKEKGALDVPFSIAITELHFPEGTDFSHPIVSPCCASEEQLKHMPKTIIRTAAYDSLRAEAERFAQQLKQAGVEVYIDNAEGMPHGYFEYGFTTGMGAGYLGEDIQKLIKDGSMHKEAEKCLDFIAEHFYK